MKVLVAFILALPAACGGVGLPDRFTDDRLAPIVNQFVVDAHVGGLDIDADTLGQLRVVQFIDAAGMAAKNKQAHDAGGDTLGLCLIGHQTETVRTRKLYSWTEVHILQPGQVAQATYSDQASDVELRLIVYHELAHCLLGVGHAPQAQGGIMAPAWEPSPDDQKLWPSLVDELFSPRYYDALPAIE